ncbi:MULTISPECIES: Sec-independent protein translocase protein TatB [Shimia]|uniref:Sec-independent protein translocase protein TatB n=1 Tax=Shimia TaxID=573139 RepID=UPI001FB5412C|nr:MULTISPECIES: Sec-independent protein translocase protein TatB [Shimia]MDV4143935.1 Sec-independent protein translocase protein TatB [Shimia sp. FJ5]
MFDLGMPELLVIGVVALIVVGPKDLPVLFRKVGQFVGKAKGMAREFSSAMNQAADQAGVKDVSDSLRSATDGIGKVSNPMKTASDAIRDQAKSMTDFDPESETGKLSAERAEAAKKIREASAAKAEARIAKEKKAAEEAAAAAKAAEAGDAPSDAGAEKDDKA